MYEIIRKEKIIAIVRAVSGDDILDVAEALADGGIKLMEITCNTPDTAKLIRKVSEKMQGRMHIGAGTVLSRELAEEVCAAGAKFILAPDVNPEVIEYCVQFDISVIPGAFTPTEILYAMRLGARMVKLFPAGVLGTGYIKQLQGPIDNLDIVAVGGVDEDNAGSFIKSGCSAVGIGSSLIRKEWIKKRDYQSLSSAAKRLRAKVDSA